MKKIILFIITALMFVGCNQAQSEKCKSLEIENAQIEKDINSYMTAWNLFFDTRDSKAINTDSFDEQVTVVTASGNITGIDAFRNYYNNYLTGFSDAEFTFIDVLDKGIK